MIITASDRVTALGALVAQLDAPPAALPAEAEHVEGIWMLEGQADQEGEAALVIDRYGLRIVPAYARKEDGGIREDVYARRVYLTGPAVADLRRHLRDLWQCPECGRWMRGPGVCAMCGREEQAS